MASAKSERSSSAQTASDKGFVDKAWELQGRIESRASRVGKGKYGRVLRMARKPSQEEFNQTAKTTGLGLLVIGLIGFVIF
ncbi:MAG: protein translocase SEC61 complex subunit gamma, partial [Candidatus Thermoplasmatota archaeon]|nr:protein translocase SEC61 complex subunit gamma [Candidatus Thermoplasmatota archaeon]